MLNYILAILLIIAPWSFGAVLAAKISESVRGKLKHLLFGALFAVAINVIIIGHWIFILVLGGIAGVLTANTFMGPYEGYLPGRLDSFLASFLGGYYWSRFLLPRIRERWEFVSLAIIPMIIWVVLALPSISKAKAKEDTRKTAKAARIEKENAQLEKEKIAIRQDTKSCIFSSKKYNLPYTPYFSCRGGGPVIPDRYVTFGLKNTNKRVHKLRNAWVLEWQDDCEKNIVEDKNCDFVPPPISFILFNNLNSIPGVRGWVNFHKQNNINPERTKSWANKPHMMPLEDLLNKVMPPDQKILFWSVEPAYFETGELANFPLFTKGVRCTSNKYYQKTTAGKKDPSLIKKYGCSATFAIFEGDLNDPIGSSNTSGYAIGEVELPGGIWFRFKADSVDEIASKFIDGQTEILAYLKYIEETYPDEDYVPPKTSEK